MGIDWRSAASDLFEGLLARTHLSRPSDVARIVVEETERALAASEVVLYWVNREQRVLVPLANAASPTRAVQDVEGTIVGRSFTTGTVLSAAVRPGRFRVYVPVMDGTDRVGVLELVLEVDDRAGDKADDKADETEVGLSTDLMMVLERLGHVTAMSLVGKLMYGDDLELVQRSRAMDLGAELLWSMVPPLTFATDGLVLAAMLEPAYDNGGDAFDYAVNDDLVHVGVFDSVGHGLPAAGLSTFALAAYRYSRRTGLGLDDTYATMDAAIVENFTDDRFVTAVFGRLDPGTGVFSWVNAGHPPPLLLRDGKVVKVLEGPPVTPLGMPMFDSTVQQAEEHLEPGDALVLYTDGVTEARRGDNSLLGLEGLIEFLEREAAARQPAPETLRRLRRARLADGRAELRDDATVLMVEWRRDSEVLLVPQTVLAHERPPGTAPARQPE